MKQPVDYTDYIFLCIQVILQFSDVDLSTISLDTLGLGNIGTTLPNTADNQVALVAGGVGAAAKTLGTAGKRGTATVTIPEAKCDKVKYFCALLYAADDARFVDLSSEISTDMKYNTTCIVLTTAMKQCHPGKSRAVPIERRKCVHYIPRDCG
jgi:hypothetical protein